MTQEKGKSVSLNNNLFRLKDDHKTAVISYSDPINYTA